MKSSILPITTAAIIGLVTTGAVLAQSHAEILAAAKAEGEVLVYTSSPDAEMEAKIAAFEASYPEIRVTHIRLPSGQLFTRFIGEHDAGVTQADLLAAHSSALFQERPELFIPLTAENLPVLGEQEIIVAGENSNYQIFSNDIQLVTYNTETVSADDLVNSLATWEDLADPRWKNKVALVDPRNSANQVSFLLNMERIYGAEWFAGFMANEPEIVGTASSASQQVAAGAFDILVPTIPSQSAAVRAQGAPVGMYGPEGFTHVTSAGFAVPAAAPHKNAALVFANWLLSPEAQIIQCTVSGIPNIKIENEACAKLLPEDFSAARDVIPSEDAERVFGLVGLQP